TAAFSTFVACSDALRTVIDQENGIPRQRVLDALEFSPDYFDFSAEADPLEAYSAWADKRCRTPFDFRARLFDSALVKLGEEKYVWYFCQHHILSDMFSFIIAAHHLSALYDKALEGTLDTAEPLPAFAAYVEEEFAQRAALGDPAQRAYWEARLAKGRDPIVFYGKPVPRMAGTLHREHVDLGEKLSRQIRELAGTVEASAKSGHAALFNIFAAILFAYLSRICGVGRPSLGMPFHNRRSETRKQTVGLFMSVLPIAVDVEETDTLNSLVAKIGAEASTVLRNSPYYIHNLMHTQAHDILVNGLFMPFPVFAGEVCEFHWPLFPNVLDPLVMNFYDNPATGNFGNLFAFNTAIFSGEIQRALIQDYDRVAHALLDNPDTPIAAIDLMSEDEKRRVLIEWNDTGEAFPADQTVHQLFEAQVERTPDAAALVYAGRTLTYRELNTRANQVAHHLKGLGVQRETLVGLCVGRSIEMVTGLLGILKAGGAYVPLDPAYPRERLAFMLEDSKIEILITTERLRPNLPVNGATVVSLDQDAAALAARMADNPVNGVGPKDLAYVIYTSGSTGTPKGAAMPHRALANLVHWQAAHSESRSGATTLQFAPLSFDVSFQEMFCTWAAGGALVLIDDETRRDARALLDMIAKAGVERIFLPYVALQGLAQTAVDTNVYPSCLKEVVTAGEQLSVTGPIRTFFSNIGGCTLVNQYGPTESHVVSSYVLRGAPEKWPVLPPIGRPIDNTRLYVLDRSLRPVPVGVPGELYIGGEGLARGYWRRPDLTQERFVRDPFANGSGGRLYKSGDIVRYRDDGNIEFLGRVDHQVKVRGYRIELGEIESVIVQHPAVAETVVVARQDGTDGHELVAYVVPRTKGSDFVGDLKAHLKGKLPDYMVPSAFVVLDKLPLAPSGKVDRGALPKPDRQAHAMQGEAIAPRDAIELELQHIWEQIFDVRPIGVADSFFDLGGHSLSAVFMMDQIQLRLNTVLSPSILFEAPTIEAIADAVRRRDAGGPGPVMV
ncbi:MAG: amino acid adenylation domain-containing protein, partial [Candidatus Hydrogenedentes bacterium]|nr:amino acid adenylation domain-containing protein [Candidatus Hydrogenedentota bacterium]